MKVRLWGTRGSLAAPGAETERFGGNTSCVEVRGRDGTLLVLDAGTGIRRLGAALGGNAPRRVHVLLTHLHPDHTGLAERVRAVSGAWIGAHPDSAAAAPVDQEMRRAGMPDAFVAQVTEAVTGRLPEAAAPRADRRLADGDEITIGGRTLRVLLTPGHAPGHLVFYEETSGLAFAGDLALPRTFSHVGAGPASEDDPVAQVPRGTRGSPEMRLDLGIK